MRHILDSHGRNLRAISCVAIVASKFSQPEQSIRPPAAGSITLAHASLRMISSETSENLEQIPTILNRTIEASLPNGRMGKVGYLRDVDDGTLIRLW